MNALSRPMFYAGFFLQKLLPGALGVIALPWLFRFAGDTAYKQYSLTQSLLGAVSTFTGAWLGQSMLRNIRSSGYDKRTLQIFFWGLLACAIFASGIAIPATRFGLIKVASYKFAPIILASIFLTLQSAIVPGIQAVGRHAMCVLSEVARTIIPIACLSLIGRSRINGASIDDSIAIGAAVALIFVLPPLFATWRAARGVKYDPFLGSIPAFLAYGTPLSIYSGASLTLQYIVREGLARNVGANGGVGALLFVADLVQRMLNAVTSPLIASQVPRLVVYYTNGAINRVRRIVAGLQFFIIMFSALLIIMAMLWRRTAIHPGFTVLQLRCFIVFCLGGAALQMTACAQKIIELRGATMVVATYMLYALGAASFFSNVFPSGIEAACPGLYFPLSAFLLYALTNLRARKMLHAVLMPTEN